jgi:catechol 2,3-dioxygenase-like lactoylglutathione lyase family enzyme
MGVEGVWGEEGEIGFLPTAIRQTLRGRFLRLFGAVSVCIFAKADGQPKRNQKTRNRAVKNESAVQFKTVSRIHMGLAVRNLERSVAFYRALFGQEPTKNRPRYAKFEVAEPPVNLALNEAGGSIGPNHPVAHFGIQVKSTEAVGKFAQRLMVAGLETVAEENVTCCYAIQNKVWATDPDGNKWEVYVVLDNDATQHHPSQSACCSNDCCEDQAACCTLETDSQGARDASGRSSARACSV